MSTRRFLHIVALYALAILLSACGGGGSDAPSAVQPTPSPPAALVPPAPSPPAEAVVTAARFEVVPAQPRQIALIVSAAQLGANRALIDSFAASVVADLNKRGGPSGPKYSTVVMAAASSALAVREQLKGNSAALLIGDVVVPQRHGAPYLDPYRVPRCGRYMLSAGDNQAEREASEPVYDPECRYGIMVAVLRGRSPATELADVARKLKDMTAYHLDSDRANAASARRFQHTFGGWYGGGVNQQFAPFWAGRTLYASDEVSYLDAGTGIQRLQAFASCLGAGGEICSFDGHGSPDGIAFEGPGTPGEYYSTDSAVLDATELAIRKVDAKYVSLTSCSTQNFSNAHSFGTELLMAGKTLLVLGSSQITIVSNWHERAQIEKRYAHLAYGATVADAFFGTLESTPEVMQGDPFISFRPLPTGAQPILLIDGKRYMNGNNVLPLAMPDAVGDANSDRMVRVGNGGEVPLRLLLQVLTTDSAINGTNFVLDGQGYSEQFRLMAPSVVLNGGVTDMGDRVLTVAPGSEITLHYRMKPVYRNEETVSLKGRYTASYEIHSNDPQAFRTVLELSGTAR